MDVIDRINSILKERGLTGADLSRKIGVSTAEYSQWNTKKTKPSNKNILKVAEALDVPVSELLGYSPQKEKIPAQGGDLSLNDIEFWEKALDGLSSEMLQQVISRATSKFLERGQGK